MMNENMSTFDSSSFYRPEIFAEIDENSFNLPASFDHADYSSSWANQCHSSSASLVTTNNNFDSASDFSLPSMATMPVMPAMFHPAPQQQPQQQQPMQYFTFPQAADAHAFHWDASQAAVSAVVRPVSSVCSPPPQLALAPTAGTSSPVTAKASAHSPVSANANSGAEQSAAKSQLSTRKRKPATKTKSNRPTATSSGNSSGSEDFVTVSTNEMNELLDDHRNVELRKKQKRDYARKKRAFERTLREKFPVLEAEVAGLESEVASLQKQNELLKSQLAVQQTTTNAPALGGSSADALAAATACATANLVSDAHAKLDGAVKQLAAIGFSLQTGSMSPSPSPVPSHSAKKNNKKTNKRKDTHKMDSGSSSPSSSSDDESSPSSPRNAQTNANASNGNGTVSDLSNAIGSISHLLEETHMSAETQLNGLQNLMDSAPIRAMNVLSSQLGMAVKVEMSALDPMQHATLNAAQASEQALMAMRAAHQQLTVAMREYALIAKRSFGHLAASLSPEQLALCFQGMPLQ